MADLGSVALIAVGLFVGLFSGAGGSFLVERTRHDRDLQRRGADVLGPILHLLLIDAHPDRVAINVGPHTHEQLQALQQKASQQLEALSAIAIQLPQPGRDHAKELAVAVHNSLHSTGWLVHDLLNPHLGRNIEQGRDRATEAHAQALALSEKSGDDLRRLAAPWRPTFRRSS